MTRDHQRQAVYRAENQVMVDTLHRDLVGLGALTELATALFTDPWWRTWVRTVPDVGLTRSDSYRSYARYEDNTIRLSPGGQSASVLAHEAAHVATWALFDDEVAAHGPEFRTTHVDVAALMCGQQTADRLAGAYLDAGLKLVERRWERPEPPGRHGHHGRWRDRRSTGRVDAMAAAARTIIGHRSPGEAQLHPGGPIAL